MKTNTIQINLAENNELGKPRGRVVQIQIATGLHDIATLECNDFFNGVPVLTNALGNISMYGYTVKTGPRHEWVGNIMWNQYDATVDYALGFLNLLLKSGQWSVSEGYTAIDNKWDKKGIITSKDMCIDGEEIKPLILNCRKEILAQNPDAKFPFKGPVAGEN